jgi:hypothetical protein
MENLFIYIITVILFLTICAFSIWHDEKKIFNNKKVKL